MANVFDLLEQLQIATRFSPPHFKSATREELKHLSHARLLLDKLLKELPHYGIRLDYTWCEKNRDKELPLGVAALLIQFRGALRRIPPRRVRVR